MKHCAKCGSTLKKAPTLIMVKPALAYLDIICRVKQETGLPGLCLSRFGRVFCHYGRGPARLARFGPRDAEALTAIKRAGADQIITYWATEFSHSYD